MSSSSISHDKESYFSCIYCLGPNEEFGYKNNMPWEKIKCDMDYFKRVTSECPEGKHNIVIMGRLTFQSIKAPLKNRVNIVITSLDIKDVTCAKSLPDALIKAQMLIDNKKADKVFIIGGNRLISESVYHPRLEYIYETRICPLDESIVLQCDNYLYLNYDRFKLISTNSIKEDDYMVDFVKYKNIKKDHPENAYLNYMAKILNTGKLLQNRTGINTLSLTSETMEVEMYKYGFPLYTTKRIPFKGLVSELLFFISGKSQTKILEQQGVNIWVGNTRRKFLDKRGLTSLEEGNMGEGYGNQWRHFGYSTIPNEDLIIGQGGFDQLKQVIEDIKKVKEFPDCEESRRLVVSAWNPLSMKKTALPPCHLMYMFSVRGTLLNIMVIMRSNDVFLGNPWNIASYSLLTYMICYLTDLIPGKLTLCVNDAHIYVNLVDQVKEQLSRPPRDWPRLEIKDPDKVIDSIDKFKIDNILLHNYTPHPSINGEMAI